MSGKFGGWWCPICKSYVPEEQVRINKEGRHVDRANHYVNKTTQSD